MTQAGPGGTYTRGWETVGHWLSMFRESLRVHLALSLVFGLVAGLGWFHVSLGEAGRGSLSTYARASFFTEISKDTTATFAINDSPERLKAGEVRDIFREKIYRGRSFGFLLKQLGVRVVGYGILAAVVLLGFVYRRGVQLAKAEKRRGGVLVDPKTERRKRRVKVGVRIALWAVLLSLVFWRIALPEIQIRYFWPFVTSGAYTRVPLFSWVAEDDLQPGKLWQGNPINGFVDNEELYRSIRKNAFGGEGLSSLFGKLLRTVLALALGIWSTWFGIVRLKKDKTLLRLSEIPIQREHECYHFLVSGSPGSGKSTAIKEILDQVRSRGQRAIVYDPSGEYIQPYYRAGKDVILNPLDQRSRKWSPWSEIREPTDCANLARSLFPAEGKDPFWADAGATLFAATVGKLGELGEASNTKLHQLLSTGSIQDLGDFLQGTSASKFLDEKAGAMPSNLIATVNTKIEAWSLLSDGDRSENFSIRRFVEEGEGDSWLFLSMRQDQQASLRPLVSLWCDVAASAVLSLPPSFDRRVWFVLDEVASLQRLPALSPLLERGRKHGAAILIGLQSIAQLRDVYGRDGASALAAQPQTWLVLRTVEPETAQWLERAIGEEELDEARESISMGADRVRDGVSIQKTNTKKSLVLATEIMGLPDRVGYLKTPGGNEIYRVEFPVKARAELADGFIPRDGG